jgi:hypothetical protein
MMMGEGGRVSQQCAVEDDAIIRDDRLDLISHGQVEEGGRVSQQRAVEDDVGRTSYVCRQECLV